MRCIWNLRSWVNWKVAGWAGWPNSAFCQFLWLSEDPQTKPPASITQLTVHLGRHTQACLTSNVNMAKHWDTVGLNSWARGYVWKPRPPLFLFQAKIGTNWCFLRAVFTKRVAWNDDKGMNFGVRQTQVRILLESALVKRCDIRQCTPLRALIFHICKMGFVVSTWQG